MARLSRILFGIALTGIALSLLATLVWVVASFGRPLDGVEGDVLFEAQRIRRGLPLYVDPTIGAREYGEPPARYLVLYPPLWSAFLAIAPNVVFGRIVATIAWLGVLGFVAFRAPKRTPVAIFAAFIAGTWVLAFYGSAARPDALAIACAGIALERAVRLGRADAISGVLFALAAWTKPNVIGAAPGALLASLIVSRPRTIVPALLGLLGTSAVIAGVLSLMTGRAWLDHLLASTAQPPSLALWTEQLRDRLPFFALPLGGAFYLGWKRKSDPSVRIATFALATSLGWALLSLAKIGSASNYFMEPCVAALVLLGYVDVPRHPALAAVLCVQIAWNGTAAIKSSVSGITLSSERAEVLANLRQTCGASAKDVILADEPGLELSLNGRIVATPFQTTHRIRSGHFPAALWIADIERAEARCFVAQNDILERPLDDVIVEHDRFGPELRKALAARFEHVTTRAGFFIYRARR